MYKLSARNLSRIFSPVRKFLLVMKLVSAIVTLAILQVSAAGYAQKLTLKQSSATLEDVFKQIEIKSGYHILCDADLIKSSPAEDVNFKNASIEQVLHTYFPARHFAVTFKDNTIIIKQNPGPDPGTELTTLSPQEVVTGTVTDAATGSPLSGVTIHNKGGVIATTSDGNGDFSIEVNSRDSLVFSFIGYGTKTVPVKGSAQLQVSLQRSNLRLDQLVVVSYGKQKEEAITGALQSVDFDKLEDLPVIQPLEKLRGKLSGVQITQATGQPGRGMQIMIRGQMSISAGNEPLYVVDGFPITGDISFMNPDDIQSITVLKDATSTSLYGSRGANGVILVTTKHAENGVSHISLDASVGFQRVPGYRKVDMMDAFQLATFKKQYFEDAGLPVPDIFQEPSSYKGKSNDWVSAIYRTGINRRYNLSIINSTEHLNSAIMASVQNWEGVVLGTNYKNYSLRINEEYKASDKVKIGFNLAPNYIYDRQIQSDGGRGSGIVFDAMITWPNMPIYDSTGKLTYYNTLPGNTGNIWGYANFVRAAKEIQDRTQTLNLLSNAYVIYAPIKGLSLKSDFNVQYNHAVYYYFQPSTASYGVNVPIPTTANTTRSSGDGVNWLNENTATYERNFGESYFELLGGFSEQKSIATTLQVQSNIFPDDRVRTVQSALQLSKGGTNSNLNEWTMASVFSRLRYNYKNKYFFTGSLRRDGSSRFGVDNRWGTFSSVSLGWIISREYFFHSLNKVIPFAKIRASYGTVGNNNIGNYTQYALVNNSLTTTFNGETVAGAALSSLENVNLGWEKTKELNLGLDMSFFDGRIAFNYDFYSKNVNNLLYNVQIPQGAGFGNFNDNVGEFKIWGHEFSVNTVNIQNSKIRWTTSANISFNRNRVLSLAPGITQIYHTYSITKVGHPVNLFYGLKKLGYYQNASELQNSPVYPGRSSVGSIKFKDVNGDGVISYGGDNDDRTFIGNPYPKFVYGISTNLAYGSFELFVSGNGSYGGDVFASSLSSLANLDGSFNMVTRVADRWRSEQNPGKGLFGTTVGGGNVTGQERDLRQSGLIFRNSYFTIRNVTLGYDLKFKNFKTLKSGNVYASVQDLYTFSKDWWNENPESQQFANDPMNAGAGQENYPVPRTFVIGVKLNF